MTLQFETSVVGVPVRFFGNRWRLGDCLHTVDVCNVSAHDVPSSFALDSADAQLIQWHRIRGR